MPAFNRFNAFSAAIAAGVHNLSTNQIAVALTAAANAPLPTNAILADLVQIDYTNIADRAVATVSATQTDGVFRLILDNKQLDAAGGDVGPFRYVVLYNDTAVNDPLIGFYDIGNEVTIIDGQFIVLAFNSQNGALIFNPPPLPA